MLWLVVFGQVFARSHAIPTGNLNYVDFLAPGVLTATLIVLVMIAGWIYPRIAT